MESAAVVPLVETFEEPVGLLFFQSDACIFYPDGVTLNEETYPDNKGNYFAVTKLVVDWDEVTKTCIEQWSELRKQQNN